MTATFGIVFVRNRHYFHAGKPYLDKVIVYENVPPSTVPGTVVTILAKADASLVSKE